MKQGTLLDQAPRLIGIFALFVWAHGIFGLWPLPPKSNLVPIELEWSMWRETLLVTVIGLVAGTVAYREIRFWWLGVLLTSGIFFLLNLAPIVSDIERSSSFTHWLNVWFTVFGRLIDQGRAMEMVGHIYTLFLYPFYHLLIVALTLLYLGLRLRRPGHVRPTAV